MGGGSNNIQLEAGRRIWLVSPAYAKALEGRVPSGSLTGGAYAKAGRVLGHLEDLLASVTDSPQHLGAVAGAYAEAIQEHLPEIIGITAGFILAEAASAFLAATPTGVGQLAAVVIQLGLAAFGAQAALDAGIQALEQGQKWLTLAWTAKGDPKKLQEASQAFLKMLVSVALAALAVTGMKGNLGKGFRIADAIKIQPPRLGSSPAMVTPEGVVVGGGPVFTPGSIASTGPVHIEPNLMASIVRLGSRWKPRDINDPASERGCESVARQIQRLIGGVIHRIEPLGPSALKSRLRLGAYRGKNWRWAYHDVVVKDGRAYDAFTGWEGLPVDEYKRLWQYPDGIDFGF